MYASNHASGNTNAYTYKLILRAIDSLNFAIQYATPNGEAVYIANIILNFVLAHEPPTSTLAFYLNLIFDDYPEEINWELENNEGEIIESGEYEG